MDATTGEEPAVSSDESGPGTATDGGARRVRPTVAAVAVAVLLAGGGVYAAAADGGDGSDDRSRGAAAPARDGDDPPPLRLDGFTGSVEPGPGGGGVTYRAPQPLPDGPDEAAVHRLDGPVAVDDVAGLARALGVPGRPRLDGDAWAVGTVADGSGPKLRVGRQAPGTWTFARYGNGGAGGGNTDDCRKADRCAPGEPGKGAGDPSAAVGERAARAAAAPVLKELGLDTAKTDAAQLMGAVRVVNAAPVYDGLPTYGWSTGLQIGSDGQVVGGSGHLTVPAKGDVYPVVGAKEAVEQLNAEAAGDGPVGIGGCATTPPLDGPAAAGRTQQPCESSGPAPGKPVEPLAVEDAELGLAVAFVDGRQTLVPSWLFTVAPDGDGPPSTVARTAVEPEYLAAPEPPADASTLPAVPGDGDGRARGPRVESYRADGGRLTVRFWGGACSDYAARAVESGGSVRVEVTESTPDPDTWCVMVAKELTAEVTLDAPLGDRKVVDAGSGATVRRD
ncbi:hypothetical protein [Streptomyces sp. NPDC060194]|uniref:hypothetical protein n=1 Tax=Streptomyces sp. NPDC060194 TaxID=3347069 RepID=UPI003654DB59